MKERYDVGYIPAATRAVLSALGRPAIISLDGRTYALPPVEMPGEVVWRAELVHCLFEQTLDDLLSAPSAPLRSLMLERHRLMTRLGFVAAEADYICNRAWCVAINLEPAERATLRRERETITAALAEQLRKLRAEFELLVLRHARFVEPLA